MKLINYSQHSINNSDEQNVLKVLRSNFLTTGPVGKKFEKKICQFTKSKYAVAVNSATSGLHIACLALNVNDQDIVWTTSNSFVASANCAIHCGAKVELVDIELNTFNIDINKLEKKLLVSKKNKKLPKVLIIVHFAGNPVDLLRIKKLSKIYKFKVIEDASHALGAEYKGKKIGNCQYSDLTIFSLHPVKMITTGEGGIVTTNSKILFSKLISLRDHGIIRGISKNKKKNWLYDQKYLGYNFRLSDIQAALGISQLSRLNLFIKQRNKIANFYNKNLKKLPLSTISVSSKNLCSYHLFVILIKNHKDRNTLYLKMIKNGFKCNIHYIPIYRQSFYNKKFNFKYDLFKNNEYYFKNCLSIPIFPDLKIKNILKIIKLINQFFDEK